MHYDVVIAGGSIAGLVCAREIAAGNHSVLVIEEDSEIGTPEHCGGLVSMEGLSELGVIPSGRIRGHRIESAQIFAPNGNSFVIDSRRQKILGVDRRELDKQIAGQAQKDGASVMIKTRFKKTIPDGIRTDRGDIGCRIFVDARGISSLIQKDKAGVLPSVQYELYADWIEGGRIQVYLDQEKFPGFFAWTIPTGSGRGRIGVAGRNINVVEAIEEFLSTRNHSIIRKIYAPIWIKGPIEKFVDKKTVTIGDAAGQSKPTTAGGIYSSGMGGLFAGRAISQFLTDGRDEDLAEYQKRWSSKFGREFERQLVARGILEKVSNGMINRMHGAITPDIIERISKNDEFDFHAGAVARLLATGIVGSFQKKTLEKIRGIVEKA